MTNVRRLYTYFHPKHYNLKLELEREKRTFSGTVTVQGEKVDSSEHIRLHAKDLTIISVGIDDSIVPFRREEDELVITASLPKGPYSLTVHFSGAITDAMHGLYPCYFEHDGIKKELLATQFESHHAREVFPCIDEPEAKATFDVALVTEANVVVLGNMPIKSESTTVSQKETVFETTLRMSTYLLAFVVGEIQSETATSKSGVTISTWATVAQPQETLRYGLDMSIRLLDFYEDYFGVPFPLSKIDHVALPDFDAGAMENWGLITYRETALLVHPERSTLASKQYVAAVISHELSHQWFGNLVTMRWWNDLWLNESFARLMEYIPLDKLEPTWNVWDEFTSTVSAGALARDALDGIQAVQTEVRHPDEISTLFDPYIVYSKGARLVRMLHEFVGDVDFKRGLQLYFERYAYTNTSADDLWNTLSEVSSKDIKGFMDIWIKQPGYPVVEVKDKSFHQAQFFIGRHENKQKHWPIPIAYGSNTHLFEEQSAPHRLTSPTLLNDKDAVHAIVNYPSSWYSSLLETATVSPIQMMKLLNEQTLLARSGESSSSLTLTIINSYKNTTSHAVWQSIISSLSVLQQIVGDDDQSLKRFVGGIAQVQYKRLGATSVTNEPLEDRKLRPLIMRLMAYADNQEVINTAEQLFTVDKFSTISPDIRAIIAGICVVHSPRRDNLVLELRKLYATTLAADLRQDIMLALCMSRDEKVTEALFDDIEAGVVRPQDVRNTVRQLMANHHTRGATWRWLRSKWSWIKLTFGGDMSYSDYPTMAGITLRTTEDLNEYRKFFVPKKHEPKLTRTIELGDIQLEATVENIKRNKKQLLQTLENLTQ